MFLTTINHLETSNWLLYRSSNSSSLLKRSLLCACSSTILLSLSSFIVAIFVSNFFTWEENPIVNTTNCQFSVYRFPQVSTTVFERLKTDNFSVEALYLRAHLGQLVVTSKFDLIKLLNWTLLHNHSIYKPFLLKSDLCLLFIVAVSNVQLLFQQDPFFLNFPNCLLCSDASRREMEMKVSFLVQGDFFRIYRFNCLDVL